VIEKNPSTDRAIADLDFEVNYYIAVEIAKCKAT